MNTKTYQEWANSYGRPIYATDLFTGFFDIYLSSWNHYKSRVFSKDSIKGIIGSTNIKDHDSIFDSHMDDILKGNPIWFLPERKFRRDDLKGNTKVNIEVL